MEEVGNVDVDAAPGAGEDDAAASWVQAAALRFAEDDAARAPHTPLRVRALASAPLPVVHRHASVYVPLVVGVWP